MDPNIVSVYHNIILVSEVGYNKTERHNDVLEAGKRLTHEGHAAIAHFIDYYDYYDPYVDHEARAVNPHWLSLLPTGQPQPEPPMAWVCSPTGLTGQVT